MKFRRRKYIVNPGFQIRTVLIFTLASFAGSFLVAAVFNFYALKKLETVLWSIHMNAQTTGDLIKNVFLYMNIATVLIVSALLIAATVWMRKKTTGPIYKMAKEIQRAAQGDLSVHITLRQKDEFQDVAQELDYMIQNVKKRFRTIVDQYQGISKPLEELTAKVDAADTDFVSALSHIAVLEKELTAFKLREHY